MPHNLPTALLESLQHVKGFDAAAFERVHQPGGQITSVRKNPGKIFNIQQSIFDGQLEKVKWASHAFYLTERPSFTADPLFHAGAYYVQEASSMFLEETLKQTTDISKPIKVLDLCAAPGGKSTLLQSLISNESLLVSNEVIKPRVNILAENITKWGTANVIVTNNDPKDFQRLQNYFDVIVVDAPCSGSGLFRKDATAIEEWSEKNVMLCSQRQQRILADIFSSLKEGGTLIYSTCSYSEAEDECIADWLMEQFPFTSFKLELDNDWGIVETKSKEHSAYGYRFYPDKVKGEGFFIAAFKKENAAAETFFEGKQRNRSEKLSAREIEVVRPWLKNVSGYFFIKQNDEVIALPAAIETELPVLQNALYLKKAGVKLGSIIRNELIPHHELAMSNLLADSVNAAEADRETALDYLRRNEINIDTGYKGWALLTHRGLPLGWVKLLPNRVNNYYPKDWRILNK